MTYDSYCSSSGVVAQIKVGATGMAFKPGDKTHLADGIYCDYDGIVVVNNGKVVNVFEELKTKWGQRLSVRHLLNRRNPHSKIAKAHLAAMKAGVK